MDRRPPAWRCAWAAPPPTSFPLQDVVQVHDVQNGFQVLLRKALPSHVLHGVRVDHLVAQGAHGHVGPAGEPRVRRGKGGPASLPTPCSRAGSARALPARGGLTGRPRALPHSAPRPPAHTRTHTQVAHAHHGTHAGTRPHAPPAVKLLGERGGAGWQHLAVLCPGLRPCHLRDVRFHRSEGVGADLGTLALSLFPPPTPAQPPVAPSPHRSPLGDVEHALGGGLVEHATIGGPETAQDTEQRALAAAVGARDEQVHALFHL